MNNEVYEAIDKALTALGLANEGGGDDSDGGIYTDYSTNTPEDYEVRITIKN